MQSFPDLRIITKAARLYYEEQLTQTEIAAKLGTSQVAVSRLLKRAEEYGIVRTTVISPPGAFAELEGLLEQRFGLSQMVIAEAARDTEEAVLSAIGSAAAQLVESRSSLVKSLLSRPGALPCCRWSIRCIRSERCRSARSFNCW